MKHIPLAILALAATTAYTGHAQAQTVQAHVRQPAAQASSAHESKLDTKLPIEITADSLEVLQHENKAIFKGNVVAVQGTIRLKSDDMIVHYKQSDKTTQTPQAPKPKTPASQGDMGAITLIEVHGHVLVATPEESAIGDQGNYDVPTRILHLTGDNVVLTKGKNIIRGTSLEYDMETGRSILTNTGTRVRSLFVPNQEPAKPGTTPAK